MQTGPLFPPPLCIHWLRCGLNLYGTRRFYPPGTRRFYLYSLAELDLQVDPNPTWDSSQGFL
jgi:hypothetical protein